MRDVNKFVDTIILHARKEIKESELLPTFYVGKGEHVEVIGAHWNGEADKNRAAAIVREHAIDADFVVFVSETWALRDPDASKEYMENRDNYPDGLSTHPKAGEFLMVQIETKNSGVKMGMAEIKDRNFGEVEFMQVPELQGRFSSFITSSKGEVQ